MAGAGLPQPLPANRLLLLFRRVGEPAENEKKNSPAFPPSPKPRQGYSVPVTSLRTPPRFRRVRNFRPGSNPAASRSTAPVSASKVIE